MKDGAVLAEEAVGAHGLAGAASNKLVLSPLSAGLLWGEDQVAFSSPLG